MFGERYFATRERLAGVMQGIASLAQVTGTDLNDSLPVQEAADGLGPPFLFVVCGEVNAGKSTLLNGFFGRELCKANVLPETSRVMWYRYGPVAKDVEITPTLVECDRPIDFLRDFHLVDTPGTNSVVKGHQEITSRFLPSADLILFVFPVTNPWGAATWDFLGHLTPDSLERVVFIIQQADQREPADLSVILGHMRDLSLKRIGQVPPMFAVSGKIACEAKRSSPFAARQLETSGYPALEDFISRRVCESPERRAKLEQWRSQCAGALRAVEDRIEDQTRGLNRQSHFLEEIEREIDSMRERFVARLPRHLTGVTEVFESEAGWVGRVLRKRLRAIPSVIRLFSGDRTGLEMEMLFIERLQSAVEAVAEKDGAEVVEACRAHWHDLIDRVRESMGVELGDTDQLDETLTIARTRFVQRLGRAARQGISHLKVRNQLDKELRRRNIALKSFTVTTLLFLIIGATCGIFNLPWLPEIFSGVAGLFALGGGIAARATRGAITTDFHDRLHDACGTFANTLREDYEEALRIVFQDYVDTLDAVRKHLAAEKLAIEPRLRLWKDLFLTLKAIEQDL